MRTREELEKRVAELEGQLAATTGLRSAFVRWRLTAPHRGQVAGPAHPPVVATRYSSWSPW